METFVNLIVTNGMSVVIIAYFLYKDYRFNSSITSNLTEIKEVLTILKTINKVE